VHLLGVAPDPAGHSPPDLQALAAWLGDARVVGLGESFHGVDDFHRLAHRIFAHLAQDDETAVFALELSQAQAARLDDYVQGRRDDLDALLAERWWGSKIFYDQALRDLLRWMRARNRAGERRPVHVAGFDFKQPSFAEEDLATGLRRLDPAAAEEAATLFSHITRLGGLGLFPNVVGYTAEVEVALAPRHQGRTLRLDGWLRGEGVSHGTVGVSLQPVDPGAYRPPAVTEVAGADLGGAWTPVHVELEVPAGVAAVRVGGFHRGNGTAWFDDLSLTLEGEPIGAADLLGSAAPRPLMMPHLQVMDYAAARDAAVVRVDGASLRVACDPAVDAALAAARRLEELVEETLAAAPGRMSGSDGLWLRQRARLVAQAVQWRTLVERNRDVFLAENLLWLQQQAFAGSRVLALAHASHTEARPRRMGSFLAAGLGDGYRTVSMLALSGRYAYFGHVASLRTDAPLEVVAIAEDRGDLASYLASLGDGDLLIDLRRLQQAGTDMPDGPRPDVAVVLRRVAPIALTRPGLALSGSPP